MKSNARQKLIAAVTFLGGVYFFLEFVLPETLPGGFQFGKYHEQISRGVQIVGTMAIGLGLINIVMVHGTSILKVRKGWYNSVALLTGLALMFLFQGIDFVNSEKSVNAWKQVSDLAAFSKVVAKENADDPQKAISRLQTAETRLNQVLAASEADTGFLSLSALPEEHSELNAVFTTVIAESSKSLQSLLDTYRSGSGDERAAAHVAFEKSIVSATETTKAVVEGNYSTSSIKKASSLLFNGFFAPLGAAMFSLLAFYIATAAYRTFRIRSVEAGIMMLAAVVVMLGQMPHGPLYIYEGLPAIRRWLLLNLSTPAFRAIFFGAIIAGLAMATRMWLSLEKSPLADSDGGA